MSTERISQRRIAELLDLSAATVSRSLRNDRSIHPQTRARVMSAAAKLGYRLPERAQAPNESGGLAVPKSVEVVVAHPSGSGRAGEYILAGISRAASCADARISVHVLPVGAEDRPFDANHLSVGMRSGAIDGLVLMHPFSEEALAPVVGRIPIVSIVHRLVGHDIDCIDIDQRMAVESMVQHLVDLGHRRIGFLGWGSRAPWEQRRLAGFRDGLWGAGIPFDLQPVLNVEGDLADAAARAAAVRAHVDRGVQAWVCVADPIAYELSASLSAQGLALGKDVSITGYDGIDTPVGASPLTTVRVPFDALGEAAVRRLLGRIEDPSAPVRDTLIRFGQVVGRTTGAPPTPAV